MHLRPVGTRAVLVEVVDAAQALALATWSRAHDGFEVLEVEEVVPAATTVLFDGVADVAALRRTLAGWEPSSSAPAGPVVEIPVVYDGPDLADVAERWGTSVEGVVERHRATEFLSAFCGFAPGFAYLSGLPEELAVPRLDAPRARVPAGAVGLAGAWCGVYPTASPGGWRLLGRTDAVLWDPSREDHPALLAPGTRVVFRAVT